MILANDVSFDRRTAGTLLWKRTKRRINYIGKLSLCHLQITGKTLITETDQKKKKLVSGEAHRKYCEIRRSSSANRALRLNSKYKRTTRSTPPETNPRLIEKGIEHRRGGKHGTNVCPRFWLEFWFWWYQGVRVSLRRPPGVLNDGFTIRTSRRFPRPCARRCVLGRVFYNSVLLNDDRRQTPQSRHVRAFVRRSDYNQRSLFFTCI